ncbi:MAG TPA: cytochrome C biogenesis protein [Elusimicrobia bacterium]|nr:cytochrome C biogenesis protein [Elusimicrobiota bacterium]HBO96899.1 cytochrome C biogenesis protein [Candidatus Omnitrophota bacterium]
MIQSDTVGYGTAFLAGIVSFLSPCVLPLAPGYISFMSGLSLKELGHGAKPGETFRHAGWESLFFVLGFSTVFTALGASASAAGSLLAANMPVVTKIAGALIVLFGLHMTGIIQIPILYYHKRADAGAFKAGYLGSFLMGLAFACGWTPCIGPILSGILALAATRETVLQGMRLLFVYSMGLGIPFIITGFAVGGFLRFFARYKKYIRAGEVFAGALLVAVGILIFTDRLTTFIRIMPKSLVGSTL